ncbi:MAG TPA: L-serine ammonia-lyase, partial [Steroidobacteraceae bacterium]
MALSVFDLFKIGIGPSSSHTVGPMRAARQFALRLRDQRVASISVMLYGSLGATGKGHGTDKAILLGLSGHEPDTVDVDAIAGIIERIRTTHELQLLGTHALPFDERRDLTFNHKDTLPLHSNGMLFKAFAEDGSELTTGTYYSVGGGFVVSESESPGGGTEKRIVPDLTVLPFPFRNGDELLALCEREKSSIASIMRRNERVWRTDAEIDQGLLHIWHVMQACVKRGCETPGVLPGGYKVKRRAPDLYAQLTKPASAAPHDPLIALDWVNLWALAVNEENAAGGRVVTAPTNGAAGIVPSLMHYYARFVHGANDAGIVDFLLTAAAIGFLYKENASISGAEVGCQGEVGVACSMSAAALTAVLGGTVAQVENAAEIAMEHHLGLTCDPVGGLVQIPCIERNAIGAAKAINVARMALRGDGTHYVSLDKVIKTMRETGADMKTKYKETSR